MEETTVIMEVNIPFKLGVPKMLRQGSHLLVTPGGKETIDLGHSLSIKHHCHQKTSSAEDNILKLLLSLSTLL